MTDGQKAIPSKVEITDKLALTNAVDKLCLEILEGKMLTTIALEWGVTKSRLMYWLSADSTRSARVREARRQAAMMYDEQAQCAIADAKDDLELKKAKELAHHLRWKASKINPNDYGEKIELKTPDLREVSDQALLAKFQAMGLGAEAARLLGITTDQTASSAPAQQSQVH
jgi:hypothetical protein